MNLTDDIVIGKTVSKSDRQMLLISAFIALALAFLVAWTAASDLAAQKVSSGHAEVPTEYVVVNPDRCTPVKNGQRCLVNQNPNG